MISRFERIFPMKLRCCLTLLCAFGLIGFSPPAGAQSLAKTFTLSAASQNACIGTSDLPTIGIDISGTASLTLQPQVSINGSTPKPSSVTSTVAGSTPQATIVTSGSTSASYVAPVGGFDTFCLNVSSYSSGSLTVKLNPSSAVNASLFGGGGINFANVQSGTNTNTLDIGTNGILQPVGAGQVVSNQVIVPYMSLAAPALSSSTTGGNFVSGHVVGVEIALSTPTGTTAASVEAAITVSSCSGGNACSVTVAAPYLPPGYTYSVYSSDNGGSILANASCQNISGNCVLQSAGAGSSPPSTNTAYSIPSPLNASLCPADVNPLWYTQDSSGNWNSWMGVDPSSNNVTPTGTPEFCFRTWFNDTKVSPPEGNNTFVGIAHKSAIGTSAANQDRSLWVSHASPSGDSATRYGLEAIQAELDFNCNGCSITGSPDGEVTVDSLQMNDQTVNNVAMDGYGANVIRAEYFRSGTGVVANGVMNVIQGIYEENNATSHSTAFATIYQASCDNGVGGSPAIQCTGVNFSPGDGFAANIAYRAAWDGSFTPNASNGDWFLYNRVPNYMSWLYGGVYLPSLLTNAGTIAVQGSFGITGGIQTTRINNATFTGSQSCATAGAASWVYRIVGLDAAGGQIAGANITVNSCAATLSGTNTISLSGISYTGASQYCFYRITSGGTPSSLGKLQCIAAAASTGIQIPLVNFVDTGLAGDSSTPVPANTNSTGALGLDGPLISTNDPPTITGTGPCGTIASQVGGAIAGEFSCTGTTGASVVTFTQAYIAPHGWACTLTDITTGVVIPQKTPISTTVCSLSAAAITTNDVLTYQAVAF